MALSLTPLRSRHAQEPYSTTLNTAMSIADGIIDHQRDLIGRPQAQLDGARHIHIVVNNENTLLHSRLPTPNGRPRRSQQTGFLCPDQFSWYLFPQNIRSRKPS